MSDPKVSIITPVKVEEPVQLDWLAETIKSVKEQDTKDWEMIIVNDHSPISWRPIGDLFGDPRLRGMSARKEGVSEARNQAASEAHAPLLLPVDGDDRLAKNAIRRFLHAWNNGGEKAGFVYSDILMFGQDFSRYYRAPEYDFSSLLHATFLTVGCLHRKSDWERVGGWNPDLESGLEDWSYWITFGENGICGYHVAEPLYEYRRHAIGRLAAMRHEPTKWQQALQRLRDYHRELYAGKWPKGCCGGVRQTVAKPKRMVVSLDGDELEDPVLMRYTGSRVGSFGMKGRPSGTRYRVPGRNGVFQVERSDIHFLSQFNFGRDFQMVTE